MMKTKDKYNSLGKLIVKKLRDETYDNYKKEIDNSKSLSVEEYYQLPRNIEYDKNLQNIEDERFEFFKSLNEKQKEQLDKLILKTLDETAFNILREIEDGHSLGESISLKFNNTSIDDVYDEFLSGTFYGEYFLWLKSFSDFGEYQY